MNRPDRPVTERDFRRPEFMHADPNDYEFRGDGAIVRKDRWMTGIRNIAGLIVGSRSQFEISDIVNAVGELVGNWSRFDWEEPEPPGYPLIDIKLNDGSILRGCRLDDPEKPWEYTWWGFSMEPTAPVVIGMKEFELHVYGWDQSKPPVQFVEA